MANQQSGLLQIKPEPGLISFRSRDYPDCTIEGFSMRVVYRKGREVGFCEIDTLQPVSAEMDISTSSFKEIEDYADFEAVSKRHGLRLCLSIKASKDHQSIFYKLRTVNLAAEPVILDRIEMLHLGQQGASKQGNISLSDKDRPDALRFFSNGWQSWSFSAAYGYAERQRTSLLKFIPNAASSNPGTPNAVRKGHFSSDFFGILGNNRSRRGLLCGFLSQKQQFGSITARLRPTTDLKVWAHGDQSCLKPGQSMETDWAVLSWVNLDDAEPIKPYLELVAQFHDIDTNGLAEIPTGWCSWYQYYTKISSDKVQKNIERLAELHENLPLKIIQIDDGYQSCGGDWFAFRPGFPEGLAPLSRLIRSKGLTAGLWLAPFIVNNGAKLLQTNPEFILRNRWGRPVNAGFISEKFATALDCSFPPALDYACSVVETAIKEWGFPYLKLDFLYAGALPGKRFNDTQTCAQVLRAGLESIRRAAGKDALLLGSGVPLGSGLGLFDSVRIGADTGDFWKPKLFGIPLVFNHDPQLPALSNALQNCLTRAPMHRVWWMNDPDCLMVRPDSGLTLEEIKTHATVIAMTGGSLFLSDDLQRLPEERIKLVEILLPLIGKRAQVLDWFDRTTPRLLRLDLEAAVGQWHLLAYLNLEDVETEVNLNLQDFWLMPGDYWVSSFWGATVQHNKQAEALWHQRLKPHAVIILAVRKMTESQPQYLGSNLHISQGLEVTEWTQGKGGVALKINSFRHGDGFVWLSLPSEPHQATCNQQPMSWKKIHKNVYQLSVPVPKAEIQIDYFATPMDQEGD